MIATILEIVSGAIKMFNSLWGSFKKTTSQKIEEIKAKVREQKEKAKKGERPKW